MDEASAKMRGTYLLREAVIAEEDKVAIGNHCDLAGRREERDCPAYNAITALSMHVLVVPTDDHAT